MDHPSPSPLRMISPDPLQSQTPAHHLPTVWSPSPPMMERHFPLRSVSQRKAEQKIAQEVEPNPSDHMREPATVPIMREQAIDDVSAEWCSAPCTAAEGELMIDLGLLDREGASDLPVSAPRKCPPVPIPQKCPPLPLLENACPPTSSCILHRYRLSSPSVFSPWVPCEPVYPSF